MRHGITLDRTRYPLVIMRAAASYTQADWDRLMKGMVELIKTAPFGLVNDTREGPMPDPVQRRSIAQMYTEHEADVRKNFLASGIVGRSSLVNGVLIALNWLNAPPHPVKVFASSNAAEAWVLTHFSLAMQRSVAGGASSRGPT